jgi:hypothetical protein
MSNKSRLSSKSMVSNNPTFKSKVEQAILQSTEPITINETQQISANNERGIWANKCEVCTWKGDLPIGEYPINQDCCPDLIKKKSCKKVEYNQEIAIRYLKPPTPQAPGEIIIKHEPNKPTAPAPPLIIRQQPPRPCTPEPLVIREVPPCPPPCVPQQVVTIPGKKLPPPARKVIVERLAPIPPKPQPVIVERWMPYVEQKRRVIYQPAPPDPVQCKQKNLIIQWEKPDVCVRKEIKHLGVVCANPCEYIQKYGSTLKKSCDLPQFVKDIQPQCGIELAANKKQQDPCCPPEFELCGDVCALNLIDLDKEGLSQYKNQVREKCGCPCPPSPPQPPKSPKCDPCADFNQSSPSYGSASSGSVSYVPAYGSASVSILASASVSSSGSAYGSGSTLGSASAYGSGSGSASASAINGSGSGIVYGSGSASAKYGSASGSGSVYNSTSASASAYGSGSVAGSGVIYGSSSGSAERQFLLSTVPKYNKSSSSLMSNNNRASINASGYGSNNFGSGAASAFNSSTLYNSTFGSSFSLSENGSSNFSYY